MFSIWIQEKKSILITFEFSEQDIVEVMQPGKCQPDVCGLQICHTALPNHIIGTIKGVVDAVPTHCRGANTSHNARCTSLSPKSNQEITLNVLKEDNDIKSKNNARTNDENTKHWENTGAKGMPCSKYIIFNHFTYATCYGDESEVISMKRMLACLCQQHMKMYRVCV